MADQAARGKKALSEGNYNEAITDYTAALKISPTSPDYLIQRSTAHQRAKNYAEALADANNAVLLAQKRAKREQIVEAQFRRGCALFSNERYADAEFVFGIVQRTDEKHKMAPSYVQRTKMSIEKLPEDDERRKCTVQETPEVTDEGSDGDKNTSLGSSSADGKVSSPPQASTQAVPPQQTPPEKIRHEWYQNSENVYFTLLAKGVPKDKAQVDIQERSLNISFPLSTGSSYDFSLEPLFGAVKPEKCIPRIMPTKVEIILAKATQGQKWGALESNEPVESATGNAEDGKSEEAKRAFFTKSKPAGPAYPTSSKSGPKDWDKITKDLGKADRADKDDKDSSGMRDDDDDDDRGGDEANFFFKKLFKNSSPEVQRAMMKSYTESNGTALSTDWSEVSKGKVETVPPEGMEAKNWDK